MASLRVRSWNARVASERRQRERDADAGQTGPRPHDDQHAGETAEHDEPPGASADVLAEQRPCQDQNEQRRDEADRDRLRLRQELERGDQEAGEREQHHARANCSRQCARAQQPRSTASAT